MREIETDRCSGYARDESATCESVEDGEDDSRSFGRAGEPYEDKGYAERRAGDQDLKDADAISEPCVPSLLEKPKSKVSLGDAHMGKRRPTMLPACAMAIE